ncbi:MAG: tRNA uracil 4-sulfurtransferase ThiI [Candidatus Faecousia sp.]|nr:tRNA 4-thiouridine(8) synthase ThiI [Oscillospiraceae bacterium]MDY2557499.1 tRNA uracil 4-sulfurtransferase ThiI [Candidatus Faecousia sp.]
MNEIFLLKLGEIILKGANKRQFENKLRQNIRRRMKAYGNFDVYILQSTVYVEPEDDSADVEGAWEACKSVFGVNSICRCRPCEKNLDAIFAAVEEYLGDELDCARSFKVESKRSDKQFPMGSIAISQEIGGRLAEAHPGVAVDVHHPEYTVYVEVRDHAAYVHGPALPGAGGLPTGVGGRAMCLLSGGIDSPVSAYMMAKRGVEIESVHFFSYPYTSQLAKDKVLELARLVTRYSGKMTVNIVSFTEIQEAIRDNCPEEYFTLIMRRFMMDISQRLAREDGCGALVTGENLGQVASQTMEAMTVTGAVVDMPVFMPLVGMDKEEIVTIARKIGTLETSILPYEDCCTVFTPKHPKTKPTLGQVLHAERKLDREALIARALESVEKVKVAYHDEPLL